MYNCFEVEKSGIDNLKKFSNFVDKTIEKEIKEQNQILKQISNITDSESEKILIKNTKSTIRSLKKYKNDLRLSMVGLIYSHIEFGLVKICDEIQKQSDLKLTLKDFSEKGLSQFSKFMTYTKDTNFSQKHRKLFSDVIKIQKIRNILVHRLGELNPGDNELVNYIKNDPYISCVNNKIVLDRQFILFAIKTAKNVIYAVEKFVYGSTQDPF